MMTRWRMAALTIVALLMGFVGGAWFVGSGLAYQFIPPPRTVPSIAAKGEAKASEAAKARADAVAAKARAEAVGAAARATEFRGGSANLGPLVDRTDLLPAPGCSWVVEPRPFQLGRWWFQTDSERALGGESSIEQPWGRLLFTLVQSTGRGVATATVRPVFFDADADRHLGAKGYSGSARGLSGSYATTVVRLDPARTVALDKIAYFAIELVAPDADRLLADAAHKEAKDKGMEILPAPVPGKPYAFDLHAADDTRARSADFRGKALVVVVWAPGASADFEMQATKTVRQGDKPDALAIVGITFDDSIDAARKMFAKSGAEGPLVVVPTDKVARRLWRDGAQIKQLPTCYVLDREGVLRFVCSPYNLKHHVDLVLGRVKPPFAGRFGNPVARPTGAPLATPRTAPAPRP